MISETTPSAAVDQDFDTRLFGAHFDQCKRLEALIEPPGFTGKAPGPEISWRSSASAGLAISGCSLRRRWASTPSLLRADPNSAPIATARPRTRQRCSSELGGAKVILAMVTNAKAMSVLIGGLGIDGKLLVVGVSPEAIEVSPLQLIGKRALVAGWPSGRAADSEDTMRFSALEGVTPWSRLSRSPRPPKD